MFDKVVRHFYDDACVVPEKAEGQFPRTPGQLDQSRSVKKKKNPACTAVRVPQVT